MKIGDLINDPVWKMTGIIVGTAWTEHRATGSGTSLNWEWLVLYQNGELCGADSNDLEMIA